MFLKSQIILLISGIQENLNLGINTQEVDFLGGKGLKISKYWSLWQKSWHEEVYSGYITHDKDFGSVYSIHHIVPLPIFPFLRHYTIKTTLTTYIFLIVDLSD